MTRFPRRAALFFIRFYQIALSPYMGSQCRFSPTCSHYAMGAIEKYGVFRGGWFAARRISKCHPWADGGYDPVP